MKKVLSIICISLLFIVLLSCKSKETFDHQVNVIGGAERNSFVLHYNEYNPVTKKVALSYSLINNLKKDVSSKSVFTVSVFKKEIINRAIKTPFTKEIISFKSIKDFYQNKKYNISMTKLEGESSYYEFGKITNNTTIYIDLSNYNFDNCTILISFTSFFNNYSYDYYRPYFMDEGEYNYGSITDASLMTILNYDYYNQTLTHDAMRLNDVYYRYYDDFKGL
jgi:hypothetical protein